MSSSSFPSLHKLSVKERMRTVRDRGLLSSQDYKALLNGDTVLDINDADNMIENVIGVMGLPVGLGVGPVRREWSHTRHAGGQEYCHAKHHAGGQNFFHKNP